MIARGQLDLGEDGGALTDEGLNFLASLGIDLDSGAPARSRHSRLCRLCLDWSERRPHLAGEIGRALCGALVRERWVAGPSQGRTVTITPLGRGKLERHFGLALAWSLSCSD